MASLKTTMAAVISGETETAIGDEATGSGDRLQRQLLVQVNLTLINVS